MHRESALVTGSAAALATAYLLDDEDAFGAVADGLTTADLPLVLAEAAATFRSAAYYSLSVVLGRVADDIDVMRAWQDQHELTVHELTFRHDLDSPDLAGAVDWLGELLAGESWLPAHSWTLHLALAVLFVAEMFGGGFSEHWPAFLLSRELARA